MAQCVGHFIETERAACDISYCNNEEIDTSIPRVIKEPSEYDCTPNVHSLTVDKLDLSEYERTAIIHSSTVLHSDIDELDSFSELAIGLPKSEATIEIPNKLDSEDSESDECEYMDSVKFERKLETMNKYFDLFKQESRERNETMQKIDQTLKEKG